MLKFPYHSCFCGIGTSLFHMFLIILKELSVLIFRPCFKLCFHTFQNNIGSRKNSTAVIVNPHTIFVIHPAFVGIIVTKTVTTIIFHTFSVACIVESVHRKFWSRGGVLYCYVIIILTLWLIEALTACNSVIKSDCTVS